MTIITRIPTCWNRTSYLLISNDLHKYIDTYKQLQSKALPNELKSDILGGYTIVVLNPYSR